MMDYLCIWNVLHYPAGGLPITEVLHGEDKDYQDKYEDLNTKKIRQTMEGSVGMPIGI